MDPMTILVLEESEGDLGHQQRILETIPGARLALLADAGAALQTFAETKVDLMVVDDGIPDGGLAFLKAAHLQSGRRDSPVILLTANGDKDVRRAAYEYGVYNVIEKPIEPANYLCIARNALAISVMRRNDSANMMLVVDQMKALQAQVEEREVQVIYALLHAANLVDAALSHRMARVAGVAVKIAHRMRSLTHDDARRFGIAARVYDIGCLALAPAVRERRLELSGPDAARLLGPHTTRSAEVFGKEPAGLLDLAAVIALQHHERGDGRGYPNGLKSEEISVYAQIAGVAEAFSDYVTTGIAANGRSPSPLSEMQALALVERQTGTSFSAEAVDALRLMVQSPLAEPPVPAKA
jgi:putative two-component system response regulator